MTLVKTIHQWNIDTEENLEVWPESHWPGFALREADVFKTYMAWWCM